MVVIVLGAAQANKNKKRNIKKETDHCLTG